MKTGSILKRSGIGLLAFLLLCCVGCNQTGGENPSTSGTEESIGQPTEQATEIPTEPPTELPTELTTEDVTEAVTQPVPQNLQEFYIDINYDGVYERIVCDPDGASSTEESALPTVRLYGEINGKEQLIWSYQLNLKSRWTGFAVKGNEFYYFAVKDTDAALSVQVGVICTEGYDLEKIYTRSLYGGALTKEGSGSPSFHPAKQQMEASRMKHEFSLVAEGTTVLIANVDGEIVYSTPKNKLGSIALPDWIYRL